MLSRIRSDLFKLNDRNIINIRYKNKMNLKPDIMFPSLQQKKEHFDTLVRHNGLTNFHARTWSLDLFKQTVPPLIIGTINSHKFSRRLFDDTYLWTMDLPIKMPRSDVRIPQEFSQFKEFIEKVFINESLTNPHINDWYCYMCVDQRPVHPNTSQRRPGAHADSFPTGRVLMNRLSDSVYLGYDCLPTEFCIGDFTFQPNIDTSNNSDILHHFESNTHSIKTFDNYQIIKIDSGHVHQVGFNKSSQPINRTFIKITFSPDIFNRVGNDHNYLFDYDWPLYERTKERNNSSILGGYVDDSEFESIPCGGLHSVFNQDNKPSWTESKIYKILRNGKVYVLPATEGELLVTNDREGNFMTCTVAKRNDWKIVNPITEAQYFLSTDKLQEFYEVDEIICNESISPKQSISLARMINKKIRISAPWGTQQYLREGDYLVKRSNNEIYGITNKDIVDNYQIIE